MMPGSQQQQQQQPYQRFHSAPRGIRVPSNVEYNQQPPAVNNTNPMNIDQSRVAAGISPMSRLTPPGNRIPPTNPQQQQQAGMNQMNFNGPPSVGQSGIRPGNQPGNPNQQQQQQMTANAPMSPMPMNMQQQQQQQQARWSNQSGPPNQQQQQPVPPPPPPPPQNSVCFFCCNFVFV
jgi:hypothetical protein